jgi:hypothetical protein
LVQKRGAENKKSPPERPLASFQALEGVLDQYSFLGNCMLRMRL